MEKAWIEVYESQCINFPGVFTETRRRGSKEKLIYVGTNIETNAPIVQSLAKKVRKIEQIATKFLFAVFSSGNAEKHMI